jgi:hypothetical protein
MPLGAFLEATEKLQNLPGELLSVCFPGQPPAAVLEQLANLDETTLQSMISNALVAAPKHVVPVVAELSGIPEEKLIGDPDIGLDGLAEIVDAWIEVNGIVNFIGAARTITGKVKAAVANYRQPGNGSNG